MYRFLLFEFKHGVNWNHGDREIEDSGLVTSRTRIDLVKQ
jgi:hypothetical protein